MFQPKKTSRNFYLCCSIQLCCVLPSNIENRDKINVVQHRNDTIFVALSIKDKKFVKLNNVTSSQSNTTMQLRLELFHSPPVSVSF